MTFGRVLTVAVSLVVSGPTVGGAWESSLSGAFVGAFVVATGIQDAVFVVGDSFGTSPSGGFVANLSGATGSTRWQRTGYSASVLAVDRHGDVIVRGSVVAKLSAATGSEQWRYEPASPSPRVDHFRTVAVDNAGDVLTADGASVVKLSAANGAVRWRADLGPSFRVNQIAVDGKGDVVLTGSGLRRRHFIGIVLKLRGSDGTKLWSRARLGGHLAVDRTGDVVLAGATTHFTATPGLVTFYFTVVKLGGATGVPRWRRELHGTQQPYFDPQAETSYSPENRANAVALASQGDVVVAGVLDNQGTHTDYCVVKLSKNGTERWRRVVTRVGSQEAQAAAVAKGGRVIVGGSDRCMALSGRDGKVVWRAACGGGTNSIALDAEGNPVTGDDYSGVRKLRGDNGADF